MRQTDAQCPRPQTQRCFDAFPERSKKEIIKVRPGLSGIGSIVFRDEEELMHASAEPERFYDEVIMPYKGRLEEWYVANQGLRTYLACIAITAWAVADSATASAGSSSCRGRTAASRAPSRERRASERITCAITLAAVA